MLIFNSCRGVTNMYFKNRLVGRENELKDLKSFIDLAPKGKGHFLLLKGDPGIGKTSVVEELREYTDFKGALFLKGQCIENSLQPYGPLRKILIELVEKAKDDPRWIERINAATTDKYVYLIQLAPNMEDILRNIPAPRKKRYNTKNAPYFQILAEFFLDIATTENPLILFFDDLQWIDEDTVRFLDYLVSRIAFSHIFGIGAYRPEDLEKNKDHPLFSILLKNKITGSPLLEVTLSPLLRINVKEMVEDILKIQGDEIDVLTLHIFHKTRGNPFYIQEFIKYLKEQKIIYLTEEDKWGFEEEKLCYIPYPLERLDTIKDRINQLEEMDKQVLGISSVIGIEFDYNLLTKVAEKNESVIKNACQKGIDIKAIFKAGKNKYCFTHDLIREVLYQSLSPRVRKKTHLRIAENLEKQQPQDIFPLAYHFGQSGQKEKSLKYLLMGAKEAEKLYSYSQAKKYYYKAREILLKLPSSREKIKKIIDLTILVAELDWIALDLPCFSLLKEAERLAIDIKETTKLGLIYHWTGRVCYARGNPKEAADYFQRSLKIAEKTRSHRLKALYYFGIGGVKFSQSKHKESVDFLSKDIELLHDIGDEEELSYCHSLISIGYSFLGKYEEAKNHCEEGIRLAEKIRYPYAISTAFFSEAIWYFKKFSWTKAVESCKKAITPYLQRELPLLKYFCYIWIGIGHLMEGSDDEGRDYLIEGIQLAKKINTKIHLPLAYSFLGECYLRRDKINEAKQYGETALSVAGESENEYQKAIALWALSRIQNKQGKSDEAEKNIKESIAIFKDMETLPDLALCYLNLGHIYQKKNERGKMNWAIGLAKKIFLKLGLEEYFNGLSTKVTERPILHIDKRQKIVFYKGLEIKLAPMGYELFVCLATNPGKWILYNHIYENIWKDVQVELYQIIDHKRKTINSFKELIGKNGISKAEINNLIINRKNVGYLLNLQNADISIQE